MSDDIAADPMSELAGLDAPTRQEAEARRLFAERCTRNAGVYRRMAADARRDGRALGAQSCDRMAAQWEARAQDGKAMV